MDWSDYSSDTFENSHPDIGGWEFWKVFDQRPEFVKFVMILYDCTGTYKNFQIYCKGRLDATSEQESEEF